MQLVNRAKNFLYLCCLVLLLIKAKDFNRSSLDSFWHSSQKLLTNISKYWRQPSPSLPYPTVTPNLEGTQPLVMQGGDPYIRALMRTITASESNVARPYHVLYGGREIDDLSRHPEVCVPIVSGPNIGNCTTAAGRYQMLDFTWIKQAQKYHPQPLGIWRWKTYSFEAKYQDAVVHSWLSDSKVWGTDISQLLRQGKIEQVLQMLSGTWTSLGYGIETNSMSRYLPQIYQNMLSEELS
jgi:muramidase (phage lysozyme)